MPGNEVRVAGVKVGKVTEVELDGDQVRVTFQVKDAWVGDRTTADDPDQDAAGPEVPGAATRRAAPQLDPDDPIPQDRTLAPYDVDEAFNGLATTVGQIDTEQLADSFDGARPTRSTNSPEHVRGALDGLSALSKTISSRDEQLAKLLANTRQHHQDAGRPQRASSRSCSPTATCCSASCASAARRSARCSTGTRDLAARAVRSGRDNQNQLGRRWSSSTGSPRSCSATRTTSTESLALLAPFYPGVQQRPRQRPLVRQLHLRPAAAVGEPRRRRVQRGRLPAHPGGAAMTTRSRTSELGRVRRASACVLALVVDGGAVVGLRRHRTAARSPRTSPRAVGVYAAVDVRVLGVKVGTIDEVTPEGKTGARSC